VSKNEHSTSGEVPSGGAADIVRKKLVRKKAV
jgi:hypothetical protein